MERATYATKSFLIALALVKRHLTVEDAAVAAQVEVSSQIQRWGEVEDCEFNIAVLRRRSLCNCLPSRIRAALIIDYFTAHDVDFHDVRRQLGSAACLLTNSI
jgi:ATP synthase F1 complex assembly factor 2